MRGASEVTPEPAAALCKMGVGDMTAYAVGITLLLVCPWAVVGVTAVGAALARLRPGYAHRAAEPAG